MQPPWNLDLKTGARGTSLPQHPFEPFLLLFLPSASQTKRNMTIGIAACAFSPACLWVHAAIHQALRALLSFPHVPLIMSPNELRAMDGAERPALLPFQDDEGFRGSALRHVDSRQSGTPTRLQLTKATNGPRSFATWRCRFANAVHHPRRPYLLSLSRKGAGKMATL